MNFDVSHIFVASIKNERIRGGVMNVLIVGGYKGPIMEQAVRKKFEGSPVKLSVEQYLDGAIEAIEKGESYHRIVLLEFGWSRDGDIKDEEELRHRLYEFNQCYMENRLEGTEIVFVADTPESTNIVYEETLQIQDYAAIHCMRGEMSVGLAKRLLVGDLSAVDNTEEVFSEMDALEVEEGNLLGEPEETEVEEVQEVAEPESGEFTGFDNAGLEDGEFTGFGDFSDFEGVEETDFEEEEGSSFTGFDEIDADSFSDFGGDFEEVVEEIEEVEEEIEEVEEEIEEVEEEETEEELEEEEFTGFGDSEAFEGFGDSDFEGFDEVDDLDFEEEEAGEGPEEIEDETEEDCFSEDLGGFDGFGTAEKEPEGIIEKKDPFVHFMGDELLADEEVEAGKFSGFDEIEEDVGSYSEEAGFEDENYREPETVVAPVKKAVNIEEDYENQPEFSENGDIDLREYKTVGRGKKRKGQKPINYDEMKIKLDAYASRGTSIAVTGSAASGKTFVAYNLANILSKMGYNVLIVDFDLHGRGQGYITKENYKSVEIDGASVIQALKNANKAGAFVSIARPGLSLLTNGVGGTPVDLDNIVTNENLLRFINTVKSAYSYVIYDIPFEKAVGSVKEVLYSADDVLLVTEGSQYGITKTILNMANIEDLDLMEAMFSKSKLVLNKIESDYRIFGRKIKRVWDYLSVMDAQLGEWSGDEDCQYFQGMDIVGVLNKDPLVEKAWFTNSPYSGKEPGRGIFVQLLWNLL